ncbi:heat shock 70 kDa protein 12B-like [Saccostrea cucullata]|uniref:heat shock 70 kDa protein 12B-like n=1 Tax=Saccostrea cuccullata TaxID=36930 RepID=UPI002ED35D56
MADKSKFRESVRQKFSKSSKLFVVAIDFGTTFSGYAYSSKAEWTKVFTNKWTGGLLISYKAPSALLLNPDESFHSFGFDAVNNYASLIADEDCQDYLFFHRFKMILKTSLEKRIHRKTQCIAENGKSVDAMKVFTNCIKYMKDHLLEKLRDISVEIFMEDIDFVLTVPAIWEDTAKMFMREAAENAGIKSDQLRIALEPEAALIYCQLMHLESKENSIIFLAGQEKKSKYLVLDLGGETADFTVIEQEADGTFAEVIPVGGGPWGGNRLDRAFHGILAELFGEDVMRRFRTEPDFAEDYIDFFQSFELNKRFFEPRKDELVHFPLLGLRDLVKAINKGKKNSPNITIEEIIKNSRFKDDLHASFQKLHIKNSFFEQMIVRIVNLLTDNLADLYKNIRGGLEAILMVGGFSECTIVQEAVRDFFKDKCRVIIPSEAGIAVLKGAVYLGHQPHLISERVASHTYGIQIWPKFDKTLHMNSKLVRMGDENRCRDVFFRFVTKGEKIKPEENSCIFKVLKPEESMLEIGVFISADNDPRYVDENGCVKLGLLELPLQSTGEDENLEIEVAFTFDHSELQVKAYNFQTNKEYEVTFDLLSR